jgi:hypothetical protein
MNLRDVKGLYVLYPPHQSRRVATEGTLGVLTDDV